VVARVVRKGREPKSRYRLTYEFDSDTLNVVYPLRAKTYGVKIDARKRPTGSF